MATRFGSRRRRRPGSGTTPVIGTTSSGLVPQVTIGGRCGGVEPDLAVEVRALVGAAACASSATRLVPGAALRRHRAALEIGEGRLVRRDQAGAGAAFDRHVADRHAAFHRERADGVAGIFDDVAGAAGGADLADDGEDDVLGGDAGRAAARRP